MTKRWLFWDQPPKQEQAEIRRAQAAGLEFDYMQAQEWKRLIENELQRRRAKREGHGPRPSHPQTPAAVK